MLKHIVIEPYAEDVISEYGNNTWYLKDTEIKLYVPSRGNVYYRLKGSDSWNEITNSLQSELLSAGTGISSHAGNYELTTDTDSQVFCNLNVVDVGQGTYVRRSADTGVIAVSGYSTNLTPVWYQLFRRTDDEEEYTYSDRYGKKMEMIESGGWGFMSETQDGASAQIETPSGSWCARVFFQTGYGYCWGEVYP